MKRALVVGLMLLGCREERVGPVPAQPPQRPLSRASVTPPPAAAFQTGEDPPYARDSVFRPETHRGSDPVLPPDALLVREVVTGRENGEFSYFGEAIAIDGDVAVIGAPYADDGWRADSGAAYVFRRDGDRWRESARLAAPKPQLFERFGASVAVSGDVIVVGADRSDAGGRTDCGAAFVFRKRDGAWRHEATLVPESLRERSALGFSVAVDGEVVAVGAPGAEAVYIHRRTNGRWAEEARLSVPQSSRASFGHAVAIDGDGLVVGAMTYSEPLHLAGAAYVFRRDGNGWTLESELRRPRPQECARFGFAVSIRGDRALVSAPRANVGERIRAGVVALFERRETGWTAVQELDAAPPRGDEEFGRAISLTRRGAIIGSQFSDAAGLNTGAAVLFAFESGRLVRRGTLLAADLRPMNEFAFALAASDRHVFIGAPRRGESDNATGYAYIHRLEEGQ